MWKTADFQWKTSLTAGGFFKERQITVDFRKETTYNRRDVFISGSYFLYERKGRKTV